MTDRSNHEIPWVMFKLNGQVLAIPADNIREMITIPEVTPIPRAPEFVRGVINLRGAVIALVDMRMRLNQPTVMQDVENLSAELDQRRDEHLAWVDALEKTVKDGAPFTLPHDPRQCGFGKWYYNFEANHSRLSDILAGFEAPHNAAHAAAEQVEALLQKGQTQRAQEVVDNLKANQVTKILYLFDVLKQGLRSISQEIAIVVEHNNYVVAFTVDSVEAVEQLQPDSIEPLPGNMGVENSYIITMLGRRSSNHEPVLIPDLTQMIAGPELERVVGNSDI